VRYPQIVFSQSLLYICLKKCVFGFYDRRFFGINSLILFCLRLLFPALFP